MRKELLTMCNDVCANTSNITIVHAITTQVHKALQEKIYTDLLDDTQPRDYTTFVAIKNNPLRKPHAEYVEQPLHALSITLSSTPKGHIAESSYSYDFTVIVPIDLTDQYEPYEVISLQSLFLKHSCYVTNLSHYNANSSAEDAITHKWLHIPVTTNNPVHDTDYSFGDIADIIVGIAIAYESA